MMYWVSDALNKAVNKNLWSAFDDVVITNGVHSWVSVPHAAGIVRDTCIPLIEAELRDMRTMSGYDSATVADPIKVKHILPMLREVHRREEVPEGLEDEIGEVMISVQPVEQLSRHQARIQWSSLEAYSQDWHHSALPVFKTVVKGRSSVAGRPGPWMWENDGGGSFTFTLSPGTDWQSLLAQ
jgi:hypothetical protein